MKRGRLYLDEAHFRLAIADFNRALVTEPKPTAALYYKAKAQLGAHRTRDALTTAKRFLKKLADDNRGGLIRGHLLLGEIYAEHGQLRKAAEHYANALSLSDEPRPIDILAYANVLAKSRRFDAALRTLEAGMSKIGAIVTLERRALELEIRAKYHDAAFVRLDRLIANSPQPASWYYEKARLHLKRGESTEASAAAKRGLASIARLSENRRKVPAIVALKDKLQRLIARSERG